MQFPESAITQCTENIMTAIAPYLRKELGEERDNHVYNRVLRIIRQFGNDLGGGTHGTI